MTALDSPHHLPAQSGAISGHVMTDDEIERMDRAVIWRRIVRRMRVSLPDHLPAVIGHSRHLH